jgi:hypothetical protein
MKKILYFVILIANIVSYSQAPRGMYVAVGLNQTSFKSSDILSDSGIGYKLGLIHAIGFHESYNYQLEILYNKRSLDFKSIDASYQNVSKSKYDYASLDIAFLTNYYILKADEDKFFVGPQAGIVFSIGRPFIPSDTDNYNGDKILPYLLEENDFQNTPILNYGAGLGITGGYNDFKFDLRYTLGLNNLLTNVQTNSYDEFHRYTGPELKGKINTISFTFSYRIWKRIKKR